MEEISRSEENSGQTPSVAKAMEGKPSEQSNQPVYEIGFHLVPALTEEEAAAASLRLHKAIAGIGAIILAEEAPKKIPLAYRIERSVAGKREKFTEALFGFVKFELPEAEGIGGHIPGLEKMLREEDSVLRFLLIKTTREAPAQPKALFASRSLEGRIIEKPIAAPEERGEISEEELDKSIEALVGDEIPL